VWVLVDSGRVWCVLAGAGTFWSVLVGSGGFWLLFSPENHFLHYFCKHFKLKLILRNGFCVVSCVFWWVLVESGGFGWVLGEFW
jgi:hypothetical protein